MADAPAAGWHDVEISDAVLRSLTGATAGLELYRYDFKPESLDTEKPFDVVVEDGGKATVTAENKGNFGNQAGRTVFHGVVDNSKNREFLLVRDKSSGKFVLEKVAAVTRLKKTRGETVTGEERAAKKKHKHKKTKEKEESSAPTSSSSVKVPELVVMTAPNVVAKPQRQKPTVVVTALSDDDEEEEENEGNSGGDGDGMKGTVATNHNVLNDDLCISDLSDDD